MKIATAARQVGAPRTMVAKMMLALSAVALAAGCKPAVSQSAQEIPNAAQAVQSASIDPVTACNQLPLIDSQEPVQDYNTLSEELSICNAAVAAAPTDTGTLNRYGRLLLANQDAPTAREVFVTSANVGSCSAQTFLGDFAWFTDSDTTAALDFYEKAVACGDRAAQRKVFDKITYANSAYPDLIQALYNADISTLNAQRYRTASYVSGFWNTFSEMFLSGTMSPCWQAALYSGGDVTLDIEAAEGGNARSIIEEKLTASALPWIPRLRNPALGPGAITKQREAYRKAGHADAVRMIESTTCDELLPRIFLRGVKVFASTPRPLTEQLPDIAPEFHSLSEVLTFAVKQTFGF